MATTISRASAGVDPIRSVATVGFGATKSANSASSIHPVKASVSHHAKPGHNNDDNMCKVFMSNVPNTWDEFDVYRIVRHFGIVKHVSVPSAKADYEYKFAFLTFRLPSTARQVIDQLNGQTTITLEQVNVHLKKPLQLEPYVADAKTARREVIENARARNQAHKQHRTGGPLAHKNVGHPGGDRHGNGKTADRSAASVVIKSSRLEIDSEIEVNVTCFNNPDDFYVQAPDPTGRLPAIMLSLTNMFDKENSFDVPQAKSKKALQVGDFCVVRATDGDWCRALITGASIDEGKLFVHLVDYGDQLLAAVKDVHPLPASCSRTLNAQAVQCRVHGVDDLKHGAYWSPEHVEACHEWLCADAVKSIVVRVKSVERNKYSVELSRKLSTGQTDSLLVWLRSVLARCPIPQLSYSMTEMYGIRDQCRHLKPADEIRRSPIYVGKVEKK